MSQIILSHQISADPWYPDTTLILYSKPTTNFTCIDAKVAASHPYENMCDTLRTKCARFDLCAPAADHIIIIQQQQQQHHHHTFHNATAYPGRSYTKPATTIVIVIERMNITTTTITTTINLEPVQQPVKKKRLRTMRDRILRSTIMPKTNQNHLLFSLWCIHIVHMCVTRPDGRTNALSRGCLTKTWR